MEPDLVNLGLFMGGVVVFFGWGLFNAYAAARETKEEEVFDWVKMVKTVLPGLGAAFLAAVALPPQELVAQWQSIIQALVIVSSGYGWASAQRMGEKLVISSFFTVKKP